MEKFRIDRMEALEKLETAARVRNNNLADVAKAMIATLSPRHPDTEVEIVTTDETKG